MLLGLLLLALPIKMIKAHGNTGGYVPLNTPQSPSRRILSSVHNTLSVMNQPKVIKYIKIKG